MTTEAKQNATKREPRREPKKDTKSLRLVRSPHPLVARLLKVLPLKAIILAGACLAIASLYPYVSSVQTFDIFKEGEVAKETIIAPFAFDIPKSQDELEREQQEAMSRVLLVTDCDVEVRTHVLARLREYRRLALQLGDTRTPDTARSSIRTRLGVDLSAGSLATLAERAYLFDDAIVHAEKALIRGILSKLIVETPQKLSEMRATYNTPFTDFRLYDKPYVTLRRDSIETTVAVDELPVKEVALEQTMRAIKTERRFETSSLNALYELLFVCLKPNVSINEAVYKEKLKRAAENVLAIKGKVIKDTEIVRKHQEVTPEIAERLRALQQAIASIASADERRRTLMANLGRLALCLMLLLFLARYVQVFHRRIAADIKQTGALTAVVVLGVAIIRLGLAIVPRLFEGSSELTQVVPEYMIPVTVGGMLATILFSLEVGFVVTLFSAVFFGMALGFNLGMFLFALLGGFVAGFATRDIRYRWDFFRAIPTMVVIFAVFVGLWQLSGVRVYSVSALMQNMGLAAINAVMATFIAMMATTVFENVFGITTDMTLVELSDMNNPVLKRLSIEAPGTYNHSVLVANLAESAAERIGANALLARVCSYYHDIGKLEKTDYFIENLTPVERNRHSKLSPSMSALVISSHVKEGVDLARQNGLPKVVQDAILQHHGTSAVSFFYEKALEQDPHKQVQEKDFRYPGPRPQSKETAVIMLADSVEAASRSLATSSPRLLRELVRKIIRDKFLSGQLDQCDLTLRDLDEIVEGFMPVLQGIFHTRIEYPNR